MSGPLIRYTPGGGYCNLGVQYKNPGPAGPPGPTGPQGPSGISNPGITGSIIYYDGITVKGNTGLIYSPAAGTTNARVTVSGDLFPSETLKYNLGSATLQWKGLYIAPQTLYIGGVAISTDTAGNVIFTNTEGPSGITGTSSTLSTVTGAITTTNSQGVTGAAGQQGPTGETGPQGVTGEKGATGAPGPTTAYNFDGGTAGSLYVMGPAFDCGTSF